MHRPATLAQPRCRFLHQHVRTELCLWGRTYVVLVGSDNRFLLAEEKKMHVLYKETDSSAHIWMRGTALVPASFSARGSFCYKRMDSLHPNVPFKNGPGFMLD
ncbi:hypothetical protein ZWY2020_007404 [Hordeum vulgare]|nr:hypothetical protein ZWY2020_007404 [Hordeum vulgare]